MGSLICLSGKSFTYPHSLSKKNQLFSTFPLTFESDKLIISIFQCILRLGSQRHCDSLGCFGRHAEPKCRSPPVRPKVSPVERSSQWGHRRILPEKQSQVIRTHQMKSSYNSIKTSATQLFQMDVHPGVQKTSRKFFVQRCLWKQLWFQRHGRVFEVANHFGVSASRR